MDAIVCDTTVASDIFRHGTPAAVSGLGNAVRAASRPSLARSHPSAFQIAVDDEIASIWAQLDADCRRGGRNVGQNDLRIAATAVRIGAPVAALDGDFARIPGIRLIDATGTERVTT